MKKTLFVFIGGASGSGKTTLASLLESRLCEQVKSCTTIKMDDYFHQKPDNIDLQKYVDETIFDTPDMLYLDELRNHILELDKGRSIAKPIFNFKTSMRDGSIEVLPCDVIIVEGIFALNFVQKWLHSYPLYTVTVDVTTSAYSDIVQRRIQRNTSLYQQQESWIKAQEKKSVGPGFFQYTAPAALFADISLVNDSADHEALKTGVSAIIGQLNNIGSNPTPITRKSPPNAKEMALNSHAIVDTFTKISGQNVLDILGTNASKTMATKDAQKIIEFLSAHLPEEIQRALVVRFTSTTNMFGATYEDTISQSVKDHEHRSSVQVHPYPWLTAGSSNVIIHVNTLNEIEVALVYNQRRDKRAKTDPLRIAGLPDYLKLPEGYMYPKPCKGGEKGISLVSSDQMDESEELMLKGLPMRNAYKKIKASKLGSSESQPSKDYDNTTKECAIRESHEEIGLKVSMHDVHYVTQIETNHLIPNINYVYLIQSKPQSTSPDLRVDGIEIKEALWGKVKAFQIIKDDARAEKIWITLDYYDEEGTRHDIEVPIKYALMIGQAIQKFRNKEIQKCSAIDDEPLFLSSENLKAKIKHILKSPALNPNKRSLEDILGYSSEHNLYNLGVDKLPTDSVKALANLGKKANIYHKKCMVLAKAFKQRSAEKPLTAEQLIEIAHEGIKIEENYYQSKTRLFPLARSPKTGTVEHSAGLNP